MNTSFGLKSAKSGLGLTPVQHRQVPGIPEVVRKYPEGVSNPLPATKKSIQEGGFFYWVPIPFERKLSGFRFIKGWQERGLGWICVPATGLISIAYNRVFLPCKHAQLIPLGNPVRLLL